jgi:hypothetical protein
MIEAQTHNALPQSLTMRVSELATAMGDVDLSAVECGVPVEIAGNTVYPALGTGRIHDYTFVPFKIGVNNSPEGISLSLTPAKPKDELAAEYLVGLPLYDPDHLTKAQREAAVAQPGYAALNGLIRVTGGGHSRFTLFGKEPKSGLLHPLVCSDDAAMTLVGAMRRAAAGKTAAYIDGQRSA